MNYAMRSVIILGAVAILALGYFLFSSERAVAPGDDKGTATTTDETLGSAGDINFGGTTEDTAIDADIDPNSISFINLVEDRSIPHPDIDRETVFASSLVELKELTKENFKNVRERLHAEPYSALDWLDLAIQYKTVEDLEGAEEIWKYLTLASPSNSVAFNNLGDLYHFYLKDFPKAEEFMLEALKRSSDPSYFLNLFQLYKLSYKKDTNLAEETLLDGLQLNKGNINILMALAKHYEDLGETAKAITRYKEAKTRAQALGDTALVDMINTSLTRLEN